MKKGLILLSIIFSITAFASIAIAAEDSFVALAPITGLTDSGSVTSVIKSQNLADFFNNLYKYLIALAAVAAIVQITWSGLEIATNRDDVSGIMNEKSKIRNAILGLILVLSPALVFSIINPTILNLSLNLPKLNQLTPSAGGSTGGGTNTATPTPTDTTGCTVTGTLLKTAICTTQSAAENFASNCPNNAGNVPFFTTEHKATCGTEGVGPYTFVDTVGYTVNLLTGWTSYEPVASSPINSSNGNDVLRFANTCRADGGTTCMDTPIPCVFSFIPSISTGQGLCWSSHLSCTDGILGTGTRACSNNPNFTIINATTR